MKIPCDAIPYNISGIYLIKNIVNNKIYIGQSIDIRRRWLEHLRSGQPEKYSIKSERDTNTPIHKAMQKYGVENFFITILEECSKDLLDIREQYWILKLSSNIKSIGYNIGNGGQKNFSLKGENHSQAKLTQKDVDKIILLLEQNKLSFQDIANKFHVSRSTICMINTGKTWCNKNLNYPIRKEFFNLKGENNASAKITDEEVLEIRKLQSQGYSVSNLPKKYSNKLGKSSLYNIFNGTTFKHLPIWDKKNNKWIEPCIDYSSGS